MSHIAVAISEAHGAAYVMRLKSSVVVDRTFHGTVDTVTEHFQIAHESRTVFEGMDLSGPIIDKDFEVPSFQSERVFPVGGLLIAVKDFPVSMFHSTVHGRIFYVNDIHRLLIVDLSKVKICARTSLEFSPFAVDDEISFFPDGEFACDSLIAKLEAAILTVNEFKVQLRQKGFNKESESATLELQDNAIQIQVTGEVDRIPEHQVLSGIAVLAKENLLNADQYFQEQIRQLKEYSGKQHSAKIRRR
jgi:hypothetical protein